MLHYVKSQLYLQISENRMKIDVDWKKIWFKVIYTPYSVLDALTNPPASVDVMHENLRVE